MYLQLRLEFVARDLGELAEVGVARAGDQHLNVAQRVHRLCDKGFHRVRVGDVQVESHRFAAVGVDLADDVVELLHPPGAQRDREAVRRELDRGGLADPGGGPGHDGRATFGQRIKPGHSADLHAHG